MTRPDEPMLAYSPAPGPFESASILSDRAGDVLGIQRDNRIAADPLALAITTLDTISGTAIASELGATAARSRDRRREIVRAASHLFAERGYRSTSLRDISQRVGISHPGMLHHFKNKEALLDAVVDDLEGHAQYVIDHLQTYLTTTSRLEAMVRHEFAEGAERNLLLAVLATDVVNPDHPVRLRIIRLRRVWEHILERLLRVWEQQGRLQPGIDPVWAARTMVSLTLSLATREATIGSVQPSAAGNDASDYMAFIKLLLR